MNKTNWLVVGIVCLIVLLFLFGAGMMSSWGYRGWGMMGPGMMGGWGFSPFGWVGMIFMWLIPAGLIVLAVLGLLWLLRSVGGVAPPPSSHACPNCGRGVQADWKNCPYCGTALR